ncbi:MAG: TetR/AcrR family transcriptional regulator [Sphingomonadales bacterium]|nr:TetR/AcrR family transcriptional regulator [Sphingomonadales bacterium]MBD3772595.1 TetR/AcrR family transcriptional regulator [Paracoccaceae bacterium]
MQAPRPDGGKASTSRDRFLVAAAEEFVEDGYDRCTIRAVAARAGTSLASFSRNWADKRQLFAELFELHFAPINREQLDAFAALQRRGDARLANYIAGFYAPVLEPRFVDARPIASHKVYCQALADPSPEVKQLVRPLVTEVRSRLIGIVRAHLPALDDQAVFLAMNVIHGTYLYAQQQGDRLAGIMGIDVQQVDWGGAARTLAEMAVSGISGTAPADRTR